MFCSQCGAKQESENATTCSKCGAPLTREKDAPQPPEEGLSQPPEEGLSQPPRKRTALLALAALVVLALVAGMGFVLGRSGSSSSDAEDAFVGEWTMVSGSAEGMSEAEIAELQQAGYYVTLTLEKGGTGSFSFYLIDPTIRWKSTSGTTATMVHEGETIDLELADARLVASFPEGGGMTFAPAGEVDATDASAGDATDDAEDSGPADTIDEGEQTEEDPDSTNSTAVPTIAVPVQDSQNDGAEDEGQGLPTSSVEGADALMGNPEVGFIQIPSSWVNRTSDLGQDGSATVYFVDPDTEYTSPTSGSFAFGKAIQMSVQPIGYEEIATTIAGAYGSSYAYANVDASVITMSGRNAILVAASLPEDNLQICSIVIDRDGDGRTAVVLSCNCGSSEAQASEVLAYVATWSLGL